MKGGRIAWSLLEAFGVNYARSMAIGGNEKGGAMVWQKKKTWRAGSRRGSSFTSVFG